MTTMKALFRLFQSSFLLLLTGGSVHALSEWDGGGPDDLWTTPQNWRGDVAPVAGDDLLFPPGAAQFTAVNDFPDGTDFHSIQITRPGYLLKGNAIVIAAGMSYTATAPGNATCDISLKLSAPQTFLNDSTAAGELIFTAGNTLTLGDNLTLDDSGTPGARFRFDGVLTGSGGLVVLSQIVLSGANSFTGDVDATAEPTSITARHSSAFGPGGVTRIRDCTISLPGPAAVNIPETFLIENDLNYLTGSGVAHTVSGNMTFTSNSRLFAGGLGVPLTLSGVLDFSAPLQNALRTAAGNTTLIIAGGGANVPGPQSVIHADTGDVRFAKAPGVNAGARDNQAVMSGRIVFDADQQLSTGLITVHHPAIADLNGTTQNVGLLYMSGGTLATSGGVLVPSSIRAEPGLTNPPPVISGTGQVRVPASGMMVIDAAAPPFTASFPTLDLQCALTQTNPGSVVHHDNIGLVVYSGTSSVFRIQAQTACEARVTGNYGATEFILAPGTLLSGTGTTGPALQPTGVGICVINPGLLYGQRGTLQTGNIGFRENIMQFDILNTLTSQDHDRLVVQGSVNLWAFGLFQANFQPLFQPGHADLPGREMLLVDNDGIDPVVSNFAGMPEGYTSTFGTSYNYRLTYLGGDGNDIVLRTLSSVPTGNTAVWDAGGANQLWTNPLNWVGDVAPVPGDALTFPVNTHATPTNDFPAGTSFHGIHITTSGITFTGNRVTLTAGISASAASSYTSSMPVTLAAHLAFTANGGLCQWLPAALIDLQSFDLSFGGAGAGLNVDSVISGNGGLIHGGPAQLTLSGANTYGGQTTIGPLAWTTITHSQALGSTAGVTHISPMGRLYLGTQLPLVIPPLLVAENFALHGAIYNFNEGAHVLSGTITTTDPFIGPSVNNGGSVPLTITGEITGSGSIFLGAGFFSGGIVLSGTQATTLTGTMFAAAPLRLAKTGVPSVIGRLEFNNAPVTVATPGQIAPTAYLYLQQSQSYLIIDGVTEDVTDIEMRGGFIQTVNSGLLVLDRKLIANPDGYPSNLISGDIQLRGALHSSPGDVDFIVQHDGFAPPDLEVTGIISSAPGARMVRSGNGKAVFSGTNTFTAFTGNASAAGPEGLTEFNGPNTALHVTQNTGAIGGTGLVDRITGAGGFTAPGLAGGAPGTLSCNKFTSSSALRIELSPPGVCDALRVGLGVDLSASSLQLVPGSYMPTIGTTFLIVQNNSADPTSPFPALFEGAHISAGAGRIFRISYVAGDGNDVVLTTVAATGTEGCPTGVATTPAGPGTETARVDGLGLPGLFYTLESSPDLLNWTTHTTVQADPAGAVTFYQTQSTSPARRFYRFQSP